MSAAPAPQRTLRARDAVAITVGIVLGAGIFRTPSLVAGGVESGWALPLRADRDQLRIAAPLVRTVGDGELARDGAARSARLPSLA